LRLTFYPALIAACILCSACSDQIEFSVDDDPVYTAWRYSNDFDAGDVVDIYGVHSGEKTIAELNNYPDDAVISDAEMFDLIQHPLIKPVKARDPICRSDFDLSVKPQDED
jgi:hypothetical protein